MCVCVSAEQESNDESDHESDHEIGRRDSDGKDVNILL